MDLQKKEALKEHHQELRTGIIVANFLPKFRQMLTDVEYSRIDDKMDNVSAVDELVKILLTKTNEEFDGFCKILGTNGYTHWERKLKEKAQEQQGPPFVITRSTKPEPPVSRFIQCVTPNPSDEQTWDKGDSDSQNGHRSRTAHIDRHSALAAALGPVAAPKSHNPTALLKARRTAVPEALHQTTASNAHCEAAVPKTFDIRPKYQSQLVEHPLRDWRKLGECQKVIQHSPEGGEYRAVAVNSEGLLAVTDAVNKCVHILTNEGKLVRSIGKGVLRGGLSSGVAFDLKGNVWVTDSAANEVVKLSQNGQFLQVIHHASNGSDCLCSPSGVTVSPEGMIYICDSGNHRISVYDEEGKFLFTFGSEGNAPGCLHSPGDIAFGSDGLMYVVDRGNDRICVWFKDGTFKRDFMTNYHTLYITATSDNHLLITAYHTVMVYTVEDEPVNEFGGHGMALGKFKSSWGICVDDNGLVYVVDRWNKRMQVF